MCQVSSKREVVVSTYFSLYKNSPQTLENCTSIVSSSYSFPDKDPHTYPSLTFAFSVGVDVVWVYGVDEVAVRDGDLGAANFSLANCGGGGGGVNETNIKIIATPTYTVLATDYILWVTANCTITFPLIPVVAIAFPIRIFCRNVNITVQSIAPDLINGAASFTMKKYQQVTVRAGQANDYGLGD